MSKPIHHSTCPCDSGLAYADCCGRCHAGEAAPGAEALMRSRYSAFVLKNESYLRASWHPETCPVDLHLEEAGGSTNWLGLSVKHHRITGPDTAEVEFVARYRIGGGPAVRLHERSRFVRQDGRWLYVDGDHL
ncbi:MULTISPECIES: YchJ family metal-binding protein [unclassified Pseudoxanthomonas]|uniref:YchJ family protein n=1 Tax=unclassified Pseudoxanthomonas TaxID=2645906 RepID=UPI0030781DBA